MYVRLEEGRDGRQNVTFFLSKERQAQLLLHVANQTSAL
uniref:Uncharacterized protein n=1 Tax=Aegilops tauschii subsp. strangulata TaxID=200361 RepID=A0A452YH11_AEGTS